MNGRNLRELAAAGPRSKRERRRLGAPTIVAILAVGAALAWALIERGLS